MSVTVPLDPGAQARALLHHLLESGDIIGQDAAGRTVIQLAADDWLLEQLMSFDSRSDQRIWRTTATPSRMMMPSLIGCERILPSGRKLMSDFDRLNAWSMAVRFTVKESSEGKPSISIEALGDTLPVLHDGLLGFELADGTSVEQAEELARRLNGIIRRVSYTGDFRAEFIGLRQEAGDA
jgi:hypothetical protein